MFTSASFTDAITALEQAGCALFATPATSAVAEDILAVSNITGFGQFLAAGFRVPFTDSELFGAFFDRSSSDHKLTLKWNFNDTATMDDLFAVSGVPAAPGAGAAYNFEVYGGGGVASDEGPIFSGAGDPTRSWVFSSGMGYKGADGHAVGDQLAAANGLWGASATGKLDGNAPGQQLDSNPPTWGFGNFANDDASATRLFTGVGSTPALDIGALIYFEPGPALGLGRGTTLDIATIEGAGYNVFATPATGSVAEALLGASAVTAPGQFLATGLGAPLAGNRLYGAFLLDGEHIFTIKWVFTDGTATMDSFFSKAIEGGAEYEFEIFDAAGEVLFQSTPYPATFTPRKWSFSSGMQYRGAAGYAIGDSLSADDGMWGASIFGQLGGNTPGPHLDTNAG